MPSYQENLDRYEGYNAQVVGISIDTQPVLKAWAKSLGEFTFPLLSDFWPHGEVAKKYGVLREAGFAERAMFIIDKTGIVRYIDVHDIAEQPDEEQIFDELRKLG